MFIKPVYQSNLRITSSLKPEEGRCAVAARDLKPGDLIFDEEPIAIVLFKDHGQAACHYCGRGKMTFSLIDSLCIIHH